MNQDSHGQTWEPAQFEPQSHHMSSVLDLGTRYFPTPAPHE